MKLPEQYRRPVFVAILIHIALFAILIFNFAPAMFRAPPASAPMQTIHATAIVQNDTSARAEPLPKPIKNDSSAQAKPISSDSSAQPKPHLKPVSSDSSAQPTPHLKPISSDRSARASERVEKEKTEKLAKLQAAEKIKKAKADKLKKEKEQKILAQKKQQEKLAKEKTAKLAQAKKLKAEQKILQQKLMQQAMMSEQKSIAKADSQIQSQAQQGAIDKYKAQILSLVQSNWRIDRVNDKLKCIYSISLAPDGSVLSVTLMKSSGDDTLDQSARQAIMQSSPLPVPQNPAEFDHFRQLVLTLSPQGFVTG